MLPVDIENAERRLLGTDEITVLATGEMTGGAIFAVMIRMPPGGGPPVIHRHAPSEIYYVIDGEFTFYVGLPDDGVRRVGQAMRCRTAGWRGPSYRPQRGPERGDGVCGALSGGDDGRLLTSRRCHGRRGTATDGGRARARAATRVELLGPIPELSRLR
jgi:hypothetical protein